MIVDKGAFASLKSNQVAVVSIRNYFGTKVKYTAGQSVVVKKDNRGTGQLVAIVQNVLKDSLILVH